MPRKPTPWFRKGRGWFVQINGQQINLGHDKKTAHQKFHQLMAQQGTQPPQTIAKEHTLVCEVLDAYLDWLEARVHEGTKAQRTFDWYCKYLQSFLCSIPKHQAIDELQSFHVYQWADAHPGWKTGKRGAMTAVQRAFNWAAKAGLLKTIGNISPIKHLEKPEPGKREQIISPQEYRHLLSLIPDEEFRFLIELAWETGARPNELFTIQTDFVDLDNGLWVFPTKLSKGRSVRRVIYLTDRALEITKTLVKRNPQGRLVRNTDGNPWCQSSVKCRFQRLHEKLGNRYSLYSFRHTFITDSLLAGTDAVTTSILAGHRDTTMISRHYAHLGQHPEHLRRAVNRRATNV